MLQLVWSTDEMAGDNMLTFREFIDCVRQLVKLVKCVKYIISALNYYIDQIVRGFLSFIEERCHELA
jgi:hypothetical protein